MFRLVGGMHPPLNPPLHTPSAVLSTESAAINLVTYLPFIELWLTSSVAREGGAGSYSPPLYWHVDQNAQWEKHYVFSTFEAVLCTGVD